MKDLSYVEISLNNIAENTKAFKDLVGQKVDIMSIVKSNAYGHGIVEVSKTVLENGASYLGVVTIDEAMRLRNKGIKSPILTIGYVSSEYFEDVVNNNISLGIYNYEMAKKLSSEAVRLNKIAKLHIKIDTGLNRLGIYHTEACAEVEKIIRLSNLEVEGIFTHFSDAENPASWQTEDQLKKFNNILSELDRKGISIKYKHTGASAATCMIPNTRFNMVRIGISTYGMWPSEETREASRHIDYLKAFKLKPAFSYKTCLVEKKHIKAGELIGYGGSYRLRKDSIIGVIPVGYAEGYDRKLSNKGEVLIGGKRVKILGSVCMNMSIVDLSNNDECNIEDEVVLIGKQGQDEITAEEVANKIGTINYEVTTRIPETIKRVFK